MDGGTENTKVTATQCAMREEDTDDFFWDQKYTVKIVWPSVVTPSKLKSVVRRHNSRWIAVIKVGLFLAFYEFMPMLKEQEGLFSGCNTVHT